MIPACYFSVILLGYVFALPVPFNSTQNSMRQNAYDNPLQDNKTLDHATESSEANNNGILSEKPIHSWNETDSNTTNTLTKMMSLSRCMISLCTLNNLGHSMQFGDEKAGEATKDPHGIGKR
ncbi:uncharacterized protein zgc:193726 [Esox lucius]|uniref:uncharacterized protein zgc:193726 n=1 Tax=Esox lucius TaxID=8010 RepID=UPI00147773DE|nr:uncharacterized protein zgc:193726 [Esox lucius]